MFGGTGTQYFHGHFCSGILNMTSMRLYRNIIGFKDTNLYFTRPSVLRILNSIFEVFHMKIAPCYQVRIHTFGIYATLTTAHNLVLGSHLIQLWW